MSGGDPLGFLRALPPRGLDEGRNYQRPLAKLNSHVHLPPNFSAFASPAQAAELAAAQGVRALGTSNYYDYSAYTPFAQASLEQGVFPLFGMEVICLDQALLAASVRVNDPANPGKFYLCGKGITGFSPMGPLAAELMQVVRAADSERAAAMTERLNEVFSSWGLPVSLSEASVVKRVAERYGAPETTVYLQERHVALAFQEALFERLPPGRRGDALAERLGLEGSQDLSHLAVQDAIRSKLMKRGKPAYVAETFPDFDHVYRLVLALGGIPCYPVLADGTQPVCEFEQDLPALVKALRDRGVHCAELIPNRNAPEVLLRYVRALRAAGFPVLAGTEHNTLEMLPLEPHCAGGAPLPEEARETFWEGACVVAGHQYQVARGEEGYVDASGALAGGYSDPLDRLKAFASLGAAVIEDYFQAAAPRRTAAGQPGG